MSDSYPQVAFERREKCVVIANLSRVRIRWVRLLVVASLLASAGAAAACTSSGGGSDTFTPAPPTSTATTPSPTPSRTGPLTTGAGVAPGEQPPQLGPFEKQHTSAGAISFAGFYIKALDWSFATSDPYLLKEVGAATCEYCEKAIAGLEKVQAGGGHITGSRIRLDSSELQSFKGKIKADFIVKVASTQQAGAIVYPTATTDKTGLSHDVSFVYVSWVDRGWKVMGDFGP